MAEMQTNSSEVSAADCSSTPGGLQLLYSLGLSELAEDNRDERLAEIIKIVVEQLGASNGYILLKDGDGVKTAARRCHNAAAEESGTVSEALKDEVLKTGREVLADAINNERFCADASFQRFNIKLALCVPIKIPRGLLGLIYLDTTSESCKWDSEQLNLLRLSGLFIGTAIENINLLAEKQKNQRLVAAGQATMHISHSVKNILQLVGGAAEVIDFGLRTNQIHRVKRSWDILKPNLERVKKFTLDMLDFSKERHLEPGPCDFNQIVQSAIESLKAQLKQKKTKLHIRVDPQMPIIELDGERIHEMALNLILNAIDIVDAETGIVTVETRYSPERGTVELYVSDNGPGMTEEVKETIFLAYCSTKNKSGTGLGMPIAKQIVDQHKAKIEIDSEPGKGSTFKVIFTAKVISER